MAYQCWTEDYRREQFKRAEYGCSISYYRDWANIIINDIGAHDDCDSFMLIGLTYADFAL